MFQMTSAAIVKRQTNTSGVQDECPAWINNGIDFISEIIPGIKNLLQLVNEFHIFLFLSNETN